MVSRHDSIVQVVFVGLLAFAGPGLFNALNGLGAAGSGEPAVAAAANGALYGFFAVVGYFSSVFFNLMGPRLCLLLGGLSYAVYALCMFFSTEGIWIAVVGGTVLGCGAGIFWTAQSALMLAYATEAEKGKYTAIFWMIFNLGAGLGGLLQMGLNWQYFTEGYGGVYTVNGAQASDVAYFSFIGIMTGGSILGFFVLSDVKKVRKSDGTNPQLVDSGISPKEEIKAALVAVLDPFVWKMFFYFFYSNWYYTFEFGAINGFFFNSRAAGLNAGLYRLMNMLGAFALSAVTDNAKMSVMKRAKLSFFTNVGLFALTWTLALIVILSSGNGKVDKELSIYDPNGNAMIGATYTLFDKSTWLPVTHGATTETVGGTLINRLAWFPPNQVSYETDEIVEDGCEWLAETKSYFRMIVGEVQNADGTWPNDPAARLACLKKNEEGVTCLWDIYQCVDQDDNSQYGRAMFDIVQSSEAPLCDLYQTDICTTFNAEFIGEEILPILTNIVMGFADGIFQCYVFWLIGMMAGPSISLSVKYLACYKGIQSLGSSISWLTDMAPGFLYRYQAYVNVALGTVSLIGSYAAIAAMESTRFKEEDVVESIKGEANNDNSVSSSSDEEAK